MASYSVTRAKHATLTGSTVDTVAITGAYSRVEVLNRTGTEDISFTTDGTTPTLRGDNTEVVPAGSSLNVLASNVAGAEGVQLIGNGNGYSVIGVNEV